MKVLFLLAACCTALAQAPRDTELPSPCERLAGVERERCIAEEKAMRERLGRTETPRKCDQLFGPEKEFCLKKGGSVKTGTSRDAR